MVLKRDAPVLPARFHLRTGGTRPQCFYDADVHVEKELDPNSQLVSITIRIDPGKRARRQRSADRQDPTELTTNDPKVFDYG